jgi:superfamily II DNA helicase RecQ
MVSLQADLPTLVGQSKEKAAKADELTTIIINKIKVLQHFTSAPFTTAGYLALKKSAKIKYNNYLNTLNARAHQAFYEILMGWREAKAAKNQLMPNMILTEKAAAAIAEKLPATLKKLSAIKGVGAQKAKQYGNDIIGLIRTYKQAIAGAADQEGLF